MLNKRALVLNRHWMPIATIPVRHALVMLCRSTAQVICPVNYEVFGMDRWIERSVSDPRTENVVATPNVALHLPEVILLKTFGGVPRRQISFTRKNLYRRDSYTCQYCGTRKPTSRLTIDHIKPRCRGGQSTWENCTLACIACNTKKANKSLKDCGMNLLSNPKRPNWNPLHEMIGERVPTSWKKFLADA
jgi:5-methylcytosine-specific restriction endonuclease McrA